MTDAELLTADLPACLEFVGGVVVRLRTLQDKVTGQEMTKRQARRLARPLVKRASVVLSFAEDRPMFHHLDASERDVIDEIWAALAVWS